MREIKFRAWDKDEKKMHFDYIGGLNPNSIYKECFIGCEGYINGELMQFTGLKDKQGIEIYDRDIFESPSGILFYVLWHKDGWCYNNINDEPNHVSGRLSEIANDWKVIGNIYQNSELIK